MTECDEIAQSIWDARSVTKGNGLNTTAPIRTYADAEFIAKHYLSDQGATIQAEVAEVLYAKARAAGTVKL